MSIIGQEGFYLENGNMVWQKVYDIQTTLENYRKHLLLNNSIKGIDKVDEELYAQIGGLQMDYKGAGVSEFNTSMYIARGVFSGVGIIEFKDDRYRVTVRDISMKQNYSDALTEQGTSFSLKDFAIRNGDFRKGFLKRDAHIFDHSFTELFKIKKGTKDEW